MVECEENSSQLLLIGDSIGSSNSEIEAGDEQFYEEIEAPKFVDFTAPQHYCPDDRYWFCLRVGCDQKHEEEMDSETIYKNFVLRVMAARSPNIRLRKALDRNASRSPSKCPFSAPPKRSKPRLSNMAIISSFSRKTDDGKKGVVRSLLKPKPTTPVLKTKTKPVSAKYLTTPRNRASQSDQSLFRSVQNPKPAKIEVPKSRVAAKALVFRSPRKTIKIKTSVELRTPISRLCEGMNKLEISSQKKHALGYSGKSCKNLSKTPSTRQLSSSKVQGRPQGSSSISSQQTKSGRSVQSKVNGKLEKHVAPKKLKGYECMSSSRKTESNDMKKQLYEKVEEEDEVKEATGEGPRISSEVATSTMNSDLALIDVVGEENCLDLGNGNTTPATGQEMSSNSGNGKGSTESCGESINHLNTSNSSKEQKLEHEFMDGDDKENVAASNENRLHLHDKNMKPNGKTLFRMHDKCFQVKKEVAQAENKSLKEGLISPSPVCKLKKPKPTNPKPFRLRTDERGVLREANLERRTDLQTPQTQSETSILGTPSGKLQNKRGSSTQKKNMTIDQKVPKAAAAAPVTPESNKHQYSKPKSSPLERLEKFRKMKSPVQKQTAKPQGSLSTKKKEITSFLIPGQKLDVIHEISPEVWKAEKPTGNDDDSSWSSTCGKQPVTVTREPNFHSKHVLQTCTKSLSR